MKMSWFWVLRVAHKDYERHAAITPMLTLTLLSDGGFSHYHPNFKQR